MQAAEALSSAGLGTERALKRANACRQCKCALRRAAGASVLAHYSLPANPDPCTDPPPLLRCACHARARVPVEWLFLDDRGILCDVLVVCSEHCSEFCHVSVEVLHGALSRRFAQARRRFTQVSQCMSSVPSNLAALGPCFPFCTCNDLSANLWAASKTC